MCQYSQFVPTWLICANMAAFSCLGEGGFWFGDVGEEIHVPAIFVWYKLYTLGHTLSDFLAADRRRDTTIITIFPNSQNFPKEGGGIFPMPRKTYLWEYSCEIWQCYQRPNSQFQGISISEGRHFCQLLIKSHNMSCTTTTDVATLDNALFLGSTLADTWSEFFDCR